MNAVSVMELELGDVQGCEIVHGGLGPADELEGAVLLQQHLGGAELTVVVVAHGVAVGAGIVDDQNIPHVDLGQAALNGELVVVLAQAAGDVVHMVQDGVLLAQHGDVVVGAVHGRAHQVGGAGIQADVLPVDVLLVEHGGHQVAVGRQHEPAQLGKDGHIPQPRRGHDLLVAHPHPVADGLDVAPGLLGAVVHADAAGEVDEGEVRAGGVAQPHRQTEQLGGQLGIILIGGGIGGQEGMDAEMLGAQLLEAVDGAGHLILGHAVLGVPGHVHDGVAQAEGAAGVIAQANRLGHRAKACQEIHMGGIVQIDVGPQLTGLLHILAGGDVGGEHHIVTGDAHSLGQQELRVRGAVAAAALLMENLQDVGVGGSLHREKFLEALVPGEGLFQSPGVGTDARFVVNMEMGGDLSRDFPGLFQGQKCCFFHDLCLFSSWTRRSQGIIF